MQLALCSTRTDYIIIGSDSGRIVVLEYDPDLNDFKKLHQETYGRSGSRRIVPGQYLAADPKGRAVMIGAMEKSKLVYILNRVGSRDAASAIIRADLLLAGCRRQPHHLLPARGSQAACDHPLDDRRRCRIREPVVCCSRGRLWRVRPGPDRRGFQCSGEGDSGANTMRNVS